MRLSIVIAAHNEGDALWRTVEACIETCAGLDSEIIIADDASWDGSVEQAQRRFPQVRVVRHERRQGASPTKDLGARHARGDVLVFLDGHTRPEPHAVARLVEDVEMLQGEALVAPAVAGLDAARWKTLPRQVGHGYFLELERFDCGWLPLSALRQVPHRGRTFYESPAAIGCALAVHRELYDDLRGFDPHMRCWGVEDLDFSLKCWLMGHPILHDPGAVVGHRFRRQFDNFEVPVEQLLVNQLRMAYKNFTSGVWAEWVERCRAHCPGRLAEHPEGLWAAVWQEFEQRRASAEAERAYLMFRRQRDEFWYAQRFELLWPRLPRAIVSVPTNFDALQVEPSLEPSPSPEPCKVTGVSPDTATVCVGESETFTASGENVEDVEWSGGGDPATGSGASFTTKWNSPGNKTVTASCDGSSKSAEVAVVRVTFSPDPITTGFTLPLDESTISRTAVATVVPKEAVSDVELVVTGVDRVNLENLEIDQDEGTITFDVSGTSRTSPSKPEGDTFIEARVGERACGSVPAIVLVPKFIRRPYPEADSDVDPENVVMHAGTSPAYWNPLPPDHVKLATVWIQWLPIGINDQFGNPLDEMYEGVDVEEYIGGEWRDINQDLNGNGTYQDPVFAARQPSPDIVHEDSQAAEDWPLPPPPPTLPMEFGQNSIQEFEVRVGGHKLSSTVRRRFIATPPNHVEIQWPPE